MAKNNILVACATTTLFLLLVSLCPLRTSADTDTDEMVLDVDGNPLEVGSEYYVQSVGGGSSSPAKWLRRSRMSYAPVACPRRVVETTDASEAVKIIPQNTTEKHIRASWDVQIDSGYTAICKEDGVWSMALSGTIMSPQLLVSASGPDIDSSGGLFQINKAGASSYKITYGPPPGGEAPPGYFGDLGIVEAFVFGDLILGVAGTNAEPLQVTFTKKTWGSHQAVASA
uniref:Uncharacterized protein n=1 Tax=Opuntia streptacantha TaxID=393608 RepID=A0A7C9B0Z9_OPUST